MQVETVKVKGGYMVQCRLDDKSKWIIVTGTLERSAKKAMSVYEDMIKRQGKLKLN